MKIAIIGCPYTGLKNITRAINDLCINDLRILHTDNVERANNKGILCKGVFYNYEDISSSFIRYPYDLIPPHSKDYLIREETEFYKSLALLFDNVAINKLTSTWALRNRAYSLHNIGRLGGLTPIFNLVRSNGSNYDYIENVSAVKAIGNCYVADAIDGLSKDQRAFVNIEEESDGECAAIFPASKFTKKEAISYINSFRSAFIQTEVQFNVELRCYLIDNEFFIYERETIDRFDKSFAGYLLSDYELSLTTKNSISKIAEEYRLGYLCFDLILDLNGKENIIDFNPYGSFPPYEEYPEPSRKLAQLISNMSDYHDSQY
ncbi:MAG: hypothetical protein JAZ15_03160 [Candidatus Thiodiazotropha endolucinida]|nr:hypothetical protein [Candidatus Thiodiazotropha taylori]MCW4311993.1 hypothetical protein [Candidatus Thiodiazotropha taylori]